MASLLHAVVRMMVPLLLLAQGGTWTLQTGILNIGQEGALLLSAFFAVLGNHFFGSWIMGILFAIGVAVLYNLLFGLFCVTLRANIWVVGMTLNIMADAGAILLMKSIFGVKGGFRSDRMVPIPNAEFSFLPDWLVPWCNGYSLVVWITLLFFCLCWYVDSKTVFGMRLKAAGENEEALEAAGIRVSRLRYATLLVNSFAVGLGGAFLSTSYLFGFTQGMSAGRGWMAVGAVIFGGGSMGWMLAAVLIFSLAQAGGNQLQALGVPSYYALMLPYILVILSLVVRQWMKRKA
ncbi:MAG TPA: ABC transporter permease [Synergistaceae bacterium]|nr:ABC transporter permease [Synergistaceae bacterium]HPJ25429.1 ABC transporter permease [Synergistaceae bacterium]HPQ37122.1 ABC transporter permease [Synergistaceae bacterium]